MTHFSVSLYIKSEIERGEKKIIKNGNKKMK